MKNKLITFKATFVLSGLKKSLVFRADSKKRAENILKAYFELDENTLEIEEVSENSKEAIISNSIGNYISEGKTFIFSSKADKRFSYIRKFLELGFSEGDLKEMREKRLSRQRNNFILKEENLHQKRLSYLRYINTCKYYKDIKEDDDFDFTEDYCILHRPTSNGKGWVMIAPGERANNHYTEDPVLVKFLYKKFKVNEQV